jgi:hypothetical protein
MTKQLSSLRMTNGLQSAMSLITQAFVISALAHINMMTDTLCGL